ncbi:MAG TPA: hypothetical protein PK988_02590 [Candidatus Sumerlaeota bacterium]|nr:hypothetical protein [Candidatus Sumerlaeota bacterium]
MPRLRGVYRQSFRWSRALREASDTTATLTQLHAAVQKPESAMAVAALVAANDRTTTPLLDQTTLASARTHAQVLLANNPYRWGPEPLLQSFISPQNLSLTNDSFAEFLMDQTGEDEVANNAYTSAEIYYVGLQEDPATFLSPLIERVESMKYPTETQEGVILSSLLLLYCSTDHHDPNQFKESWYREAKFAAAAVVSHRNFFKLGNARRQTVLNLAQQFATTSSSYGFDESTNAFLLGNRRLSWLLFEDAGVEGIPNLRKIIFQQDAHHRHKLHAGLIWLLADDHSLNDTPSGREAVAEIISLVPPYYLARMFQNTPTEEGMPHYTPNDDYFAEAFYGEYGDTIRKRIEGKGAEWREAWCRVAADALAKEADAERQMRLAEFLHNSDYEEARELVTNICISNLIDDDVVWNSGTAYYMLSELSPDPDSMRAGALVAMRENDSQMFEYCTEYLLEHDPNFRTQDEPDMLAFATSRLVNGGNNYPRIKAVLRNAGPAAKPYLTPLLESKDEYVARSARELIKDIDFLEALRKRGRKPLYLGSTETVPLDYQKKVGCGH